MSRELCERVRSLLPEHTDGETSSADAELVRRHLDACGACRREADEWRALSRVLEKGLSVPEPVTAAETEAAVQRIGEETPLWRAAPSPLRFWRSWAPIAAMAAAAGMLLLAFNYTPGVADAGPALRDWAVSAVSMAYPTNLEAAVRTDVEAWRSAVRTLPESTYDRVASQWDQGLTFSQSLTGRIGLLPLALIAVVLLLANVAFVRAVRGSLGPPQGG